MRVEGPCRRARSVALAALLAALLGTSGCGGGMGQVDGKLVWPDGKPAKELAGSQIVFESTEMRTSGRGTIDDDGNFKVGTKTADDGVPVGEYQIAFVEKRKTVNMDTMLLAPAILAAKYSDPQTSELKVTVKSGITPVTLTVERVPK